MIEAAVAGDFGIGELGLCDAAAPVLDGGDDGPLLEIGGDFGAVGGPNRSLPDLGLFLLGHFGYGGSSMEGLKNVNILSLRITVVSHLI